MKNEIEIPISSILWYIIPTVKEVDSEMVVDLQWGWTAGMSDQEVAETWADDAPRGYDSVVTSFDGAIELRDKLTALIDKHKERAEQLKAEWLLNARAVNDELDRALNQK